MNTKKILGIFICMLVISMVPVAAGATATVNKDPEPTDIGWTTLQGIVFGIKELNGGAIIEFRCLFVHYVGQGLLQRTTGIRYGGQMMVIPGAGFKGLLLPGIILGYVPGVLEF